MLILKFHLGMKCLRVFSSFFHTGMKFHFGKNVYTVKGCLHAKFHPGMKPVPGRKHPCLWWDVSYSLHVFAEIKFHPGINSSLSKRRAKFHPGMKKEKKMCKYFILGWNFKISMFFLKKTFDVCIQIPFPKLTCLNIMKVWI